MLTAPSGSGKTTIGKKLEREGVLHLDHDSVAKEWRKALRVQWWADDVVRKKLLCTHEFWKLARSEHDLSWMLGHFYRDRWYRGGSPNAVLCQGCVLHDAMWRQDIVTAFEAVPDRSAEFEFFTLRLKPEVLAMHRQRKQRGNPTSTTEDCRKIIAQFFDNLEEGRHQECESVEETLDCLRQFFSGKVR